MHGVFVVVISKKEKTTMKLAIGIDVHKDKCTACAAYASIGEPRERHLDFIEKFNKSFERFHSDGRGMMTLHNYLNGHESHIPLPCPHERNWNCYGITAHIAIV